MCEKSDTDKHRLKVSSLDQKFLSPISSVLQSNSFERQAISFLEHSPICIKILDLNFNLLYMSPAGIKSLDIDDITHFYNKPYPLSFYPKKFRDCMSKNLNKAMRNNEIVKQEASIITLKGSELWYHSTIIPVERETGQIETILVISVESTERKKADLELSKLRKLKKKIGMQFLTEHSHQKNNVSFMTKVTKIVADNMHDNNFDVNVLAKHLFMSRSTLQRKLTKESGKSAALFIRQTRLAKAHELIKNNTHQTLAETAYSVGFKHPGYFAKLYKSIY